MIRNSLKFVPYKDYKAVTTELKTIYQSITESEAKSALDAFTEKREKRYPQISLSWNKNWHNLITLFDYPDGIRKGYLHD
jgi:transposase-like protein